MSRRYRVLVVCSHLVHYSSPVFRRIAEHPRVDLLVAYCSLQGAESGLDPEFGVEVSWDTPVLDAYSWTQVPNKALRPGLGRFFGLFNPGLWNLVRQGAFDSVWVSGYFYASAWVAILAAKWCRVPLIFTTDAHSLRTWKNRSAYRQRLKKLLVRHILGLGDVILAGSSGTVDYLKSLGLPKDRILMVRNVVDNDWWSARAAQVDREAIRSNWSVPPAAPVVLFCAKLQPWKRPQDLVEAFAKANVKDSFLVIAGDGPLRADLERQAQALGITERVRMLGFVNQSQLPGVYRAADLLVLPSEHEAFGLVVNEAMLCGCPAVVSDRVGAKFDLVRDGETGFVYPCGDVGALTQVLREVLPVCERLRQMGEAARRRMGTWSPREYVATLVEAVERTAGWREPRGPERGS
ncbi:MAG: glycosyltransferase [Acidobacteria bacterium]|nr:glycosyltransferase [Acidobacteriota bacterium]